MHRPPIHLSRQALSVYFLYCIASHAGLTQFTAEQQWIEANTPALQSLGPDDFSDVSHPLLRSYTESYHGQEPVTVC